MQVQKYKFNFLKFSIALLFLSTPLESLSVLENFSIAKVSSIIAAIAWGLSGFPMVQRKSIRVFVPLLIIAVLSCLWSIDAITSFNAVIKFLIPSMLVALILDNSIESKKDIILYLVFFIVGCMITSVGGLLSRQAVLAEASYAGQERLTAFGQDQNTLAFLLVMGVVPLLQCISQTSYSLAKYILIGLIALFSIMIASTGSRTGVIIFSLVILYYIYSVRKFKSLIVLGIILVFALPFLVHFLPEGIIDRYTQTTELVSEGDFSDRGVIWSSALTAFKEENYVLGVGYFNFSHMLKEHYGWQIASHNTYLTYLIEFGIFGFWVFVFILAQLIRVAKKIRHQENSIFVYCYVFPLLIVMLTLETEYKRWLFLIYPMLCAWCRLNQSDQLKKINR